MPIVDDPFDVGAIAATNGRMPRSRPPPQRRSRRLYGPPITGRARSSSSCRPPHRVGARLCGRPMSEPLDEPLGVVTRDELRDDDARLYTTPELMERAQAT